MCFFHVALINFTKKGTLCRCSVPSFVIQYSNMILINWPLSRYVRLYCWRQWSYKASFVDCRSQRGALKAKNAGLWRYFSPNLEMICIFECRADTQRALHVHSIPESPPLWANTADHSLSVTLQHMILTPTSLLISLLMNAVVYKRHFVSWLWLRTKKIIDLFSFSHKKPHHEVGGVVPPEVIIYSTVESSNVVV